jgi:hypothetical protein
VEIARRAAEQAEAEPVLPGRDSEARAKQTQDAMQAMAMARLLLKAVRSIKKSGQAIGVSSPGQWAGQKVSATPFVKQPANR